MKPDTDVFMTFPILTHEVILEKTYIQFILQKNWKKRKTHTFNSKTWEETIYYNVIEIDQVMDPEILNKLALWPKAM